MNSQDLTEDSLKHFAKFISVGILNTLFYYGVYALFLYLNFHFTTAALLATAIAMLFSFKTFGALVFDNREKKLIFKFFLVTVINYLLNVLIIYIFKEYDFNAI